MWDIVSTAILLSDTIETFRQEGSFKKTPKKTNIEDNWMNPLSVTFNTVQSDFFTMT